MAVFITATGTDVGKTYVTCALIRALKRSGTPVGAYKPIISGFEAKAAATSDTGRILSTLGRPCDDRSIAAISPWRYSAPLSADMAAAREGRDVPFDEVVSFCIAAARAPGISLIEGVGGVMSPIDGRRTNRDLIVAMKTRPLLVAGSYLGTISHTLTALEALRIAGVEPVAVAISEFESAPVVLSELVERLTMFVPVPIFAVGRNEEAPSALVDMIAKA